MKRITVTILLCTLVGLMAMCRKAQYLSSDKYDERLSGGQNTVFDNGSSAFSNSFAYLSEYDAEIHEIGDANFESSFVTAPATINSGLGPMFNNVSCASCHHNDGIGVPTAGDPHSSLLMRISIPGMDAHGGALEVPGYGTQIQDNAIFGKKPECRVNISYTYTTYTFPDGESYELRSPTYTIIDLHMPISGSYMLSPRLAPPVFGLGLLEAIPEDLILSKADPNDTNGDGISGKPNYVWDPYLQKRMLGRFGLKANTATLLTQVAAAYVNDMGVTSHVFSKESSYGQSQYDDLQDDPELPDSVLNAVKFYVQTLAVPARRNVTDPIVLKGKQIFIAANCVGCHAPTFTTGVNITAPFLSNQLIHPYTDMLVHDMGDGLADNRPDFEADGKEWRTAPLWGVGLFPKVNFPAFYLHDGRARTLIEAIMWHGGEAEKSKNYIENLSKSDRDALLAFLNSL